MAQKTFTVVIDVAGDIGVHRPINDQVVSEGHTVVMPVAFGLVCAISGFLLCHGSHFPDTLHDKCFPIGTWNTDISWLVSL